MRTSGYEACALLCVAMGCASGPLEGTEDDFFHPSDEVGDIGVATEALHERHDYVRHQRDFSRYIGRIAGGTGWLVGPNLMMTNEHVIDQSVEEDGSLEIAVRLGVQNDPTGSREEPDWDNATPAYHLTTRRLIWRSPKEANDMALVELNGFPGYELGWASLSAFVTPSNKSAVVLAGHDGGEPLTGRNGNRGHVGNVWVFYDLNSAGGASGSPVMDPLGRVFAIHRGKNWSSITSGQQAYGSRIPPMLSVFDGRGSLSIQNGPNTRRSAAAHDFDGDGRSEILLHRRGPIAHRHVLHPNVRFDREPGDYFVLGDENGDREFGIRSRTNVARDGCAPVDPDEQSNDGRTLVGDFDGDGRDDLVVLRQRAGSHHEFTRVEVCLAVDGGFAPSQVVSDAVERLDLHYQLQAGVRAAYADAMLGDVDGDGDADLVVMEWDTGRGARRAVGQDVRVAVYRSNRRTLGGPVYFEDVFDGQIGTLGDMFFLGDVDGDGAVDLINGRRAENQELSSIDWRVFRFVSVARPSRHLSQLPRALRFGDAFDRFMFGDVTGDGRADIVGIDTRPADDRRCYNPCRPAGVLISSAEDRVRVVVYEGTAAGFDSRRRHEMFDGNLPNYSRVYLGHYIGDRMMDLMVATERSERVVEWSVMDNRGDHFANPVMVENDFGNAGDVFN